MRRLCADRRSPAATGAPFTQITLVAGTDNMPGLTLHKLEMDVQAGIPAREVLRIATLYAAKVLDHEAELGSVAPAKFADLIPDGRRSRAPHK